ncbi:MAG: DNA-directed DNA polymerase [archaeon]|nr:DNA-directed DNA polymerase [archaeon]
MKIECYPYDFQYKIEDGKTYVQLFSILKNGEKICVKHQHNPHFFASLENVKKEEFFKRLDTLSVERLKNPAKVLKYEEVELDLLGKKKPFLKITANYPKAVPLLATEIESWNIVCYERDILFIHRYLRDFNITPMTLVEVEGKYQDDSSLRVPSFLADSIKVILDEPKKDWKILALDIETYAKKKEINPQKNPILMVSFYGEYHGKEFRKVITWKNFNHELDYVEHVQDETELLRSIGDVLKEYNPDILTGYFSDGFDLPYIQVRAEKHKVRLNWGLDGTELIVRQGQGFRDAECKIPGILHLDILKFIKNIFGKDLKTDSFTLNNVAGELLNHHKHDVNLDNLAHIWDNEPEKLTEFCAYNLQDSHLTYNLCALLLPDMLEFTTIVSLPTNDVIRMKFSRLVESYIMHKAVNENVITPNKPSDHEISQRMNESIQGAFVYQPIPGMYKDIAVFDFRSLYPTIITAHNISPEGFRCNCCKDRKHVPGKEEYWFCQEEKKFLPTVLEELIIRRSTLKEKIKELKNKGDDTKVLEARSYALKILANSFYGYLGFYAARWYCIECAASTTAFARDYIQRTISDAEKEGFKVIYADTDSCFLVLGEKILEDAMNFMGNVNRTLPGLMELEYEGYFPRGIFVGIKGKDIGAKKKYALLRENGTTKITGFEMVRRNWSLFAKEVQEEILKLVLSEKNKEALIYIKQKIEELKEGKVPLKKLVLKTQLTREISQYKSIGPHVVVAMKLAEKGEPVIPGTVVRYIITNGSGLVRERAQIPEECKEGEYDAEYYLNHQLLPAVSSIFLVLGYSEENLLGKAEQKGLGDFF